MSALETLLTQYSIESIILLLVIVLVAAKFLGELWNWAYGGIRKHFNIQSEKEQQDQEDREEIKHLRTELCDFMEEMRNGIADTNERIDGLTEQQSHMLDRLQENTRSFIIDKHHFLVYQAKAVDDMTLQSLERRYMYYKADGGDSFVDNLMADIRKLPRTGLITERGGVIE